MKKAMLVRAFVVVLFLSFAALARSETALTPSCGACLHIRVGLAHMVRGPAADIADNRFTEIELPGGGFRGFDAHGQTTAIDGKTPLDMGGPGRIVLTPGAPGSYSACGQWLNHAERIGATVLGFVHTETACDYAAGQTHKSMALATSTDDGLTWRSLGQFITGTDLPTPGRNTGEGDCTAVDGRDGYLYAYCFRPRDSGLIVARAPSGDPSPRNWRKYFQGGWDQPGLGGNATRLMAGAGASIARWNLVFREIDVEPRRSADAPQVVEMLARWFDPVHRDRWPTTAPVPAPYRQDGQTGYLSTSPLPTTDSVELEDCDSDRSGHREHLLAEKGFCEAHGYRRLRTAGWAYAKPRSNTVPVYRCYDATEKSHFASNEPNCEGLGENERLLGYALSTM
ncbi:hypothetical protein [Trinickia diaoshuihuensis]|uniref:hypothetical protein n=1 Tax=Trinickia diaoshuihuensis TaxID=2292265 RepID=UPI000E25771C|nr:hypothetical protein [Trinickia diaoshuihuensis]